MLDHRQVPGPRHPGPRSVWARPSFLAKLGIDAVERFGRATLSTCLSLISSEVRTHPERHHIDYYYVQHSIIRGLTVSSDPSHAFSGAARSLPDQDPSSPTCIHPTKNAAQTRPSPDRMMVLRLHVADSMCALSIFFSTAPRFSLCCGRPASFGWLPGNVGAIICDISNLKILVGLSQLPWPPPHLTNQARSKQPATGALERFASLCRFGHFDSCASQASPCFPSCTCLRSRDTRTQGRGRVVQAAVCTRYNSLSAKITPRFAIICLQRA